MKNFLFALTLLPLVQNVNAKEIELLNVKLQGNGCPKNSHSVVVSPDQSAVSILFDQLSVEVPFEGYDNDLDYNRGPQTRNRKVCNMTFEVELPAGQKLKNLKFKTDFRGFSFGEEGTSTQFFSQLISFKDHGQNSKEMSRTIALKNFGTAEHDADIDLANTVNVPIKSNCHSTSTKKVQFLVKNYLEAEISPYYRDIMPQAQLIIDSSDLTGNFKVKLETQTCGNSYGNSRPTRPTRPGRVDRGQIRDCQRLGGTWHPRANRCIVVRGRFRR